MKTAAPVGNQNTHGAGREFRPIFSFTDEDPGPFPRAGRTGWEGCGRTKHPLPKLTPTIKGGLPCTPSQTSAHPALLPTPHSVVKCIFWGSGKKGDKHPGCPFGEGHSPLTLTFSPLGVWTQCVVPRESPSSPQGGGAGRRKPGLES